MSKQADLNEYGPIVWFVWKVVISVMYCFILEGGEEGGAMTFFFGGWWGSPEPFFFFFFFFNRAVTLIGLWMVPDLSAFQIFNCFPIFVIYLFPYCLNHAHGFHVKKNNKQTVHVGGGGMGRDWHFDNNKKMNKMNENVVKRKTIWWLKKIKINKRQEHKNN